MILQALAGHYEDLIARGKIAPPGWGPARISFALELDDAGAVKRLVPLKTEQTSGKKTALLPQEMVLPSSPSGRTSLAVKPAFLWDNPKYLLGVDKDGKPCPRYFQGSREFHHALLDDVDSPAAKNLLAFFDQWDPAQAETHPALREHWEELMKGGNLVFQYGDTYVHEVPALRQAWQTYYDGAEEGETAICLVTGQTIVPQSIHPAVKGVQGAQSSGAALVSFNAPAFCSYGKEQNLNAPVGKYAAFAYTAALNHLLADREHVTRVGDATVVCWAEGGDPAYQDFAFDYLFGGPAPAYTQEELQGMAQKLLSGKPVVFDETRLDPERPFYVLGLSPNAARLSVRFFLRNSFGSFVANIQKHYERINIVRPAREKFETIPPWKLLGETVNQNARDKSPSPGLSGEVLRAILENKPYPATLLNGVALRIRAEREITWGRAAILKAYLIKNREHAANYSQLLEAARMELNENCSYQPYVLGRLFSVMEKIQLASADRALNRTIKDSYFTSAATTPQTIFAKLFPLSDYHMKKLQRDKPGLAYTLGAEKSALMSKLDAPIPARFAPDETNCFYIGYYHQDNKKKEEK